MRIQGAGGAIVVPRRVAASLLSALRASQLDGAFSVREGEDLWGRSLDRRAYEAVLGRAAGWLA